MAVTLAQVARAISATARSADPEVFSAFHFLHPSPPCPALCVNIEHSFQERDTMDGIECQWWRLWVLLSSSSIEDSAERLFEYIDTVGERSISARFEAADAPWRLVPGLSDVYIYGFARLPSDMQGPQYISFGGPNMWGTAFLIRVLYGNEEV